MYMEHPFAASEILDHARMLRNLLARPLRFSLYETERRFTCKRRIFRIILTLWEEKT